MDKKISFKFSKNSNITMAILAVICIVGIVFCAVFLGIALKEDKSYVSYIVSMIMLIVIIAVTAIVKFASYYKFEKDRLIFSLFGLKKKIDYSDILNIRHDNITKQTIAYYNVYSKTGEKKVTMFVLSVGDKTSQVVQFFKDKNNMIIYEIFHEEQDEQNK